MSSYCLGLSSIGDFISFFNYEIILSFWISYS